MSSVYLCLVALLALSNAQEEDYSVLCPSGDYNGDVLFYNGLTDYNLTCDSVFQSGFYDIQNVTKESDSCQTYASYFNGCCSDSKSVCWTDYSDLCPSGEYDGDADFLISSGTYTCDQMVVQLGGVEGLTETTSDGGSYCQLYGSGFNDCCDDSKSVCWTDYSDLCPSGEYNGNADFEHASATYTCEQMVVQGGGVEGLTEFTSNGGSYCSYYGSSYDGCCDDGKSVCWTDNSDLCPSGEYNGDADFVRPGYESETYTCDQMIGQLGGVEGLTETTSSGYSICSSYGSSLNGCCDDSKSVCWADYSDLCPSGEYDGSVQLENPVYSSQYLTCDQIMTGIGGVEGLFEMTSSSSSSYSSSGNSYSSGNSSSGNHSSGNYSSGNYSSGNYSSGNYSLGNYSSGNYSSGNSSSGGNMTFCEVYGYLLADCCSDLISLCASNDSDTSDNFTITSTEAPTATEAPNSPTEAPTTGTEAPTTPTEAPTTGTEAPTTPTAAPTDATEAPVVTDAPTDAPTNTDGTDEPTFPVTTQTTWNVAVTATLTELDLTDWTDDVEEMYVDGVATSFGVDAARVNIKSVTEGSIVVESEVTGFESVDDAEAFVAVVTEVTLVLDDSLGEVTAEISDPVAQEFTATGSSQTETEPPLILDAAQSAMPNVISLIAAATALTMAF